MTLNIVIPMAGHGSRFSNAGYAKPKPFIEFLGKPMIQHVLENLTIDGARFILLMREDHIAAMPDEIAQLTEQFPCEIITLDRVTEGAACTVLFARKYIDNDTPLLIANSDQIVDISIAAFVKNAQDRNLDGSILCFEDDHPKWSYARLDDAQMVAEVKEKEAISSHATVGIYYFSKGKEFVSNAFDMIIRNDRSSNEFYVCPVYNYAIKSGSKIGIYNIESSQMHGTGTPDDLNAYIAIATKGQV